MVFPAGGTARAKAQRLAGGCGFGFCPGEGGDSRGDHDKVRSLRCCCGGGERLRPGVQEGGWAAVALGEEARGARS